MKSISRNRWTLAIALWVPLGLTLFLALFAIKGQQLRDSDFYWVLHTIEVKGRLDHIDFLVKDAQTSEQEYSLTGDPSLLTIYEKTVREIPVNSRSLAHLIADNPTQVAATDKLSLIIADQLAETARALALAHPPPRVAREFLPAAARSRLPVFDEIRPLLSAMTAEEDRLLVERSRSLAWQVKAQKNVMTGIVSVDLALIVALSLFMWGSQRSRQAAAALTQETEARYRSLFASSPDGIIIATPAGVFVDANPSLGRMLGYPPAELLGQPVSLMVLEPEQRHIDSVMGEIRSGVQHRQEWRFRRKDGSTFEVDTVATLMPDGNVLSMVRDITDRKRTESRFRRVVDSNAQAVCFWNLNGDITGANDAFLKLVGYSRADLESGVIRWRALTGADETHLDDRAMAEIAARGACVPFEKHYLRKDGTRVPVLIGAASFEDNPDEGMCFAIDLTETKKLEQQFLRAQRMEGIGTLAGGIAHDLNNILAPIMLSIEILRLTTVEPAAQRILETIAVSTKRGADIVRQVLSFARGMEGEKIEIQPRALVQDLEKIIKDTFPKSIRMKFATPESLGTIVGDPTQVHQVLLNLCINARDAMPEGGELTIGAEAGTIGAAAAAANPGAKAGPCIVLSVADSGTGMSPEIMHKIFDPFFTTKALHQGTGLGLSTVLAIVKSHAGMVTVDSEPGRGTVFRVYLPAAETSAGPTAAPAESALPRGQGEKVLIVDDEAAILSVTSETLQAFGYRVLTATDGAEAIALYAQHRHEIAVVLTDMSMPIMDGAATIHALMRINPAVKIIAASGFASDGMAAQDLGSSIKHFLNKPYTTGTLLAVLRSILDPA